MLYLSLLYRNLIISVVYIVYAGQKFCQFGEDIIFPTGKLYRVGERLSRKRLNEKDVKHMLLNCVSTQGDTVICLVQYFPPIQ